MIRRGRPGLLGTMARTAVVAGTATAVSGGVRRRSMANEEQAAQAAAYQQQQEQASMQAQMQQHAQAAPPQAAPPQAAPPRAATAGSADFVAELKKLADLRAAGALTDDEFAAAKARLLG